MDTYILSLKEVSLSNSSSGEVEFWSINKHQNGSITYPGKSLQHASKQVFATCFRASLCYEWFCLGDMIFGCLRRFGEASTWFACLGCTRSRSRPSVPLDIHMFWDNVNALENDLSSSRQLSPHDLFGLWSCLNVGFTVHLWSYGNINVFRHSHLHHRDASQLVPRPDAVGLLRRGLRIQHLADLVRLAAVQHHAQNVITLVAFVIYVL